MIHNVYNTLYRYMQLCTCREGEIDGVDAHGQRHLAQDGHQHVGRGRVAGNVGDRHRDQADDRYHLKKCQDRMLSGYF